MLERSFVMVKPDGVKRSLIGEIIGRFERAGLKLLGMRMQMPPRGLLERHYPATPELLKRLGDNTVRAYAGRETDLLKDYGSQDPVELGKLVRKWLIDYMSSGNAIPMVWEGNCAIKVVRKLLGATVPVEALPGTIRGDFSTDSPDVANAEFRAVQNLVHASGNAEEAAFEVELWFPELKK